MSKGNFSRNTFDKLKHYVGVRLQQGVPIVDADWNELEDIRKSELETFLKWFVGNGIPLGNDGFKIELSHVSGNIRLCVNGEFGMRTTLTIDFNKSTAAGALGFSADDCLADGTGLSVRLFGKKKEPFTLAEGMTLVISVKHTPLESSSQNKARSRTWKVTFHKGKPFKDISKATGDEVVAEIDRVASELHVSVGLVNDFIIKGGDGTPEGAGRCLVEGWEVVNESDLLYTDQPLYESDALATTAFGVDTLTPLTGKKPDQDHSNLYYLDVWERIVDEHEDKDLVNKMIGVPTCLRIKREWVVRVLEGCEKNAATVPEAMRKQGHVYYPLARFEYFQYSGSPSPSPLLVDLRRTGVSIVSQFDFEKTKRDIKAIAADAFGDDYTVNSYLNTNLREAVNAILRGSIPGKPAQSLAKTQYKKTHPVVISDHDGVIHVCWQENRGSVKADSWRLSFMVYNGNTWSNPATLEGSDSHPCNPFLLFDDVDETVLALWIGDYDHRKRCIKYTRYWDEWKGEGRMVPNIMLISNDDCELFAIMHSSYLWLFYMDLDPVSGKNVMWYNRRKPNTTGNFAEDWEGKKQIPSQSAGHPVAIIDGKSNMQVLWITQEGKTIQSITCDLKDPSKPLWGSEVSYPVNRKIIGGLSVVIDSTNHVWVFFAAENDNFGRGLWYLKISPDNQISALVQLTIGLTCQESTVRAVCYNKGEIFITWHRLVSSKLSEIWCRRYSGDNGWGQEMQIVPGIFGGGGSISLTADNWHNVYVVYINNIIENMNPLWQISCRKLLTYI